MYEDQYWAKISFPLSKPGKGRRAQRNFSPASIVPRNFREKDNQIFNSNNLKHRTLFKTRGSSE